tara:strand:+ start:115 stop:504 length:390 start_codon:yes stop_codon:yes gene_type:complete
MAICWINQIQAEAIFTYANYDQEMATTNFLFDVSADESEVISKLIKSYFDMDNAEDRELISDIVKVSFCFSDTGYPKKMPKKEAEKFWTLPVMQEFFKRNGKYYFDDEQRDDVETSIKELLDCWKEEIV